MMRKLLTESDYFLAWFLYWIVCTVGGLAVGVALGAFLGGILGAAGVDMGTIKVACWAVGFLVGMVLSYIMFRVLVDILIVQKLDARVAASAYSAPTPPELPRGV